MIDNPESHTLESVFRQHYGDLVLASIRVSRDRALSEDVVQSVFMRLHERGGLERLENPGAYLRRAVVTRTLNALRDRKRLSHPGDDELANAAEATVEVADDDLELLKERLHSAVDKLPERARIILILHRFEGLTYKEIANELNIAPKTVENQLARALKLLRKSLPKILSFFLGINLCSL